MRRYKISRTTTPRATSRRMPGKVAGKFNKAYQQLDLTSYSSEEIRRMIQFTFLKAAKEDGRKRTIK